MALGYDTSNRGEDVGRAGVELEYETTLHGQWGEIVYEVDSHGNIVREISRTDAVNGMDIQLSIDLDMQQYAERLLQTQLRLKRAFTAPNPIVEKPDGSRQRMSLNHGDRVYYEAPAGSVVVMNHQTGQVMAMASYPTFDNRWFSQDISEAKFDELFRIPHRHARLRRRGPAGVPARPRSRRRSPTGRSRASTTWARRSRCSSPGRRCTPA